MTLRSCVLAALLFSTGGAALAVDTPEQLARQAVAAYEAKDFARSADLFAAAIAGDGDDGVLFYNGACSAALAGRKAQALAWLERSVALEGVSADHMKADGDLAALHDDPRWPQLLATAQKLQAQRERLWNSPALATPYAESLSEEERIAGLSKVWAEAKYGFVNFDLVPELDWDALYLQTLPRVIAAKDTIGYYRELQRFIGQLHDGHSNVYLPKETNDLVNARPGLDTLYLEGKVIVRDVFDPRIAALGIAPGWEIVAVDGQPVAEYAAANVMPYLAYSTEQDKLSRAYERFLLNGNVATPAKIAFRDPRGRDHLLDVPRMTNQDRSARQPGTASFEWKLLPGNIAWVALRSFGDNSAAEQFEANFAEISKADAIVFDVRDNGGGNSSVGERILATLTDKPFQGTVWQGRDYRATARAWGRKDTNWSEPGSERAPSGQRLYTKPVVVLTSARTYSAAEDFTVAFDIMQRGRIVGEPTGGSTGQPLVFKLPGGGGARICTKRDTYPDGKEFVGVGVQPQVLVRPTVRDFRAGRDTVLEAALTLLRDRR